MSNRTVPLVIALVCSVLAVPVTAVATASDVTFTHGDVRLAGTLLLPEGSAAPMPAIVLVHGSGPSVRAWLRPFAERFVKDGYAALIYDKRGCGASGGDWTEASLDDLAADALAAAAYLRSRPEIDAKRIGVWGVSQAGWVIPRATARSPQAFAFAIVVTGGGAFPADVEKYDYKSALQHAGVSEADTRTAMALVDRYFDYLKTGVGRTELVAAIKASSDAPWAKAVDLARVLPSEGAREKWAWVATYDPAKDMAQINVPILIISGGQDRPGLTEVAQEVWRKGLAQDRDATLVLFNAAGHGISIGGHHHPGSGQETYAPGYFELMDAWLRAHAETH